MTTKPGPRPQVRIRSELPYVTYPQPGEPVMQRAISYEVDNHPPRTVYVPESDLPDLVWKRDHPGGPAPSEALVRKGDEARRRAIQADIERRRAAPGPRTLEL